MKHLFIFLLLISTSITEVLAQSFPINSASNIVDAYDVKITFEQFVYFTNRYKHDIQPIFASDGSLTKLKLDLLANNEVFKEEIVVESVSSANLELADYKEMHETFPNNALFTTSKELVGQDAPDFTIYNLEKQAISSWELEGQVVVLNFWFSNCAPCVEEMPDLNSLKEKYKDEDVTFLGLSIEDASKTKSFLASNDFNFEIIPEAHHMAGTYKVPGYPTTLIIGKTGKVEHAYVGKISQTFKTLDKAINKSLLKNKSDIRVELLKPEESLVFANCTVFDERGVKLREEQFYDALMNYKCDIYKHTRENQSIYYTLTKSYKK